MGSNGNLGLALVLLSLFWEGSMGQSVCTSVLIGMAPCLNYVTGSSKTPSSSCCSSLASVVKSQPQCLCSALDGSILSALGININNTIALALPGACNVNTPPVSRCHANPSGNNAPVMAPVRSPDKSSIGPSPASVFIAGSKQIIENGETSEAGGNKRMCHMILWITLMVLTLLP